MGNQKKKKNSCVFFFFFTLLRLVKFNKFGINDQNPVVGKAMVKQKRESLELNFLSVFLSFSHITSHPTPPL